MSMYLDGWRRYAQFTGRASREAFWMFILVNIVVTLGLVALEIFFQMSWKWEALYSLMLCLPLLSLTVRRLHDANRSAYSLLLVLLPVVGMLVLLIFLALPSEYQSNVFDSSQNDVTL